MTEKNIIYLINQFFEIQQKTKSRDLDFLDRNFTRLEEKLEEMGFTIMDPLGEKYKETRTDLSAHIVSENTSNLKVIEVIKPIIYKEQDGKLELVQIGNVIVGE